ncbi:hypothetical protein K3495_g11334 [Podosphaera aphanis]|nr:hypothetical protein K3495_g11334 [Podosphaera aphanis]
MIIQVPESESDSSGSTTDSFYGILDPQEHPELLISTNRPLETMSLNNPDTPMGDATSSDPPITFSNADLAELLQLLRGRQQEPEVSSQSNRTEPKAEPTEGSIRYIKKETKLPKWNGSPEDFGFFIGRLEMRVEQKLVPFVEGGIICLDMIETLPEDKKSRVSAWFEESKARNVFDWRALIQHFRDEFEDKQAMQAASEYLNRMEQGYHQYFRDFLKDFEYRVAQSGGSAVYTSHYKTMQLKASLNSRLRRGLLGVKLPHPNNYKEWVAEVKEVAAELESFADYRPKGASKTNTKLGAPKSGSALDTSGQTPIDGDGDIVMGGTNALLAALRELTKQKSRSSAKNGNLSEGKSRPREEPSAQHSKPRAPWRSKSEFSRLLEEGVCTRCTKKGHIGRDCRKFRPAQRPEGNISSVEIEQEDFESCSSGNEEP